MTKSMAATPETLISPSVAVSVTPVQSEIRSTLRAARNPSAAKMPPATNAAQNEKTISSASGMAQPDVATAQSIPTVRIKWLAQRQTV
jgi:hypothetical protein